MPDRNYQRLLAHLSEAYTLHSPRSAELNQRAKQVMVDGGSHALRLIEPFPPRIVSARGAYLIDEDGHRILDCWQGHFANLLGHNPEVVTTPLAEALQAGFGLQTGFTDRLQVEVAEILCRQTGAERVRFTTSGALATMYAIVLARAFTGRELVMKIGGGWHGGQPWGLVGVSYASGSGFQHADSAGLPGSLVKEVVLTRFNDVELLRRQFQEHGDRLACFILELSPGSGGGMEASREYVQTARALAHQYGVVLIFDEVITGFRLRAGAASALYGIQPDLATFGKIMGGGMPVAAVAGRADILNLAGRAGGSRVRFSGGTYSAHPASMLAAKTMMSYLVAHESEIYPRLADLSDQTRRLVEAAFARHGLYAHCTGSATEGLPASSLIQVHFPYQAWGAKVQSPDEAENPAVCDTTLSGRVLTLAMLLEDVHVEHGLGSISAAHSEEDVARLSAAFERAAERIKP